MLPTDVAKMTVKGRMQGQLVVNTFHYMSDPAHAIPPQGVSDFELLLAFRTAWRPIMAAAYIIGYQIEEYRWESWVNLTLPVPPQQYGNPILTGVAVQPGEGAADSGARGANPADTLFAALGIRRLTGVPGKRFQGAIRLGPLGDTDATDSALTAGGQAAWNPVIGFLTNALINAAGTAGVIPCVYSRAAHTAGGVLTNAVLYARPVLAVPQRTFLSSQVSRKRGRGAQ